MDVVISTEKAVDVFDWQRWEILSEILLARGAEFAEQIPFLDSHRISGTENTLGSLRNIRVEGDKITAKAFFGETRKALEAFALVRDKHITDVSIGYRVMESKIALPGESIVADGKEHKNSSEKKALRVSTKYRIFEGSLVNVGANDEAKIRELHQEPVKGIERMDEKEKKKDAPAPTPDPTPVNAKEDLRRATEEAVKSERLRVQEINELCRSFEIDPAKYIEDGATVENVRAGVLESLKTRRDPALVSPRPSVDVTRDAVDKKTEYIQDCINLRMGFAAPEKREANHLHLLDLARMFYQARGENKVERMNRNELAKMCFKRSFSHSTSDFPKLLENAINKRLQSTYAEAPSTYQMWAREVDVSDFKDISVVKLSEYPSLNLVAEGQPYPEASLSEEREKYSVSKYGSVFSITWESLINDDLSGFTKIASAQGYAAKRKVNAVAYAILTANDALSDAVALFHSTHANYIEGAGTTLSVDQLAVGRTKMRLQKGPKDTTLSIPPKFLIVPATLETTGEQIIRSPVVPGSNQGHSYNAMQGKFTLITEPLLDANSTTAWYLVSDYNVCDTVEVAFLEGNRVPFLDEEDGFMTDGRKYKVRHVVGAKAIDYRGLFKSKGAA